MGKKCIENPKLFLSLDFCNKYYEYYRPLERLLWGLNYYFFKTNPVPIQIYKRLLFLGVAILIYHISKSLGGTLAGIISTALIFEYPIYRRYIDTLFVSMAPALFLFLIAVSFLLSWIKYPKWNKLIACNLFSFLAFLCKEEFGIIFILLVLTLLFFFSFSKKKTLGIVFIIYLFIIGTFLVVNITNGESKSLC
jgi:hypothetical protein